jgi:predicted anti-sigma-YlaC factor YlaD
MNAQKNGEEKEAAERINSRDLIALLLFILFGISWPLRAKGGAMRMREASGARRLGASLLCAVLAGLVSGCSVKKMAVNKIGDALASSSASAFASDDDPELVRDAVPFSLKLIESLLEESPRHRGLLLAASSGFTQYSYAFVQQEADEMEDHNLDAALAMRARARKLYLRARDYGLRGLEVKHPGLRAALREEPRAALRRATRADVPLLFWTAAAWGAAISISKDRPELVADQLIVEALVDRALELDESFSGGAIHSFLISYEPNRQGASADLASRARRHFDRALELSRGELAGPLVAYAESVCIARQDRAQFESLLRAALAINPDARRETRLANLIMQRRARWLLNRADEYFADALTANGGSKEQKP